MTADGRWGVRPQTVHREPRFGDHAEFTRLRLTMRQNVQTLLLAGLLATLCACSGGAPESEATTAAEQAEASTADYQAPEIDWFQGSVEDAMIAAADASKPVFLYWGARWCPPCMQLKTTVFNRPDFVATTELFVPVYLDGDTAGAQRWGDHFGIVGYPTLIVLRPDGTELTRISSTGDLEAYPRVLRAAARQTRPSVDILEAALHEPATLSADDWTLLANYGWWVDRGTLLGERSMASVMGRLAEAAPEAERPRFRLLEYAATVSGDETLTGDQQHAAQALLRQLITDAKQLRAQIDTLNYFAVDVLVAATEPGKSRQALADELDRAMQQVAASDAYTIKDRLYAQRSRVKLFEALDPEATLPAELVADLQATVAWADDAAETPQERQAMANYATYTLEAAGLSAEAEALLRREVQQSPDAYYFMPTIARYAEARGDTDEALDWLQRAAEEARGPATRAQWGLIYLNGLLEITPEAIDRIEGQMTAVIDELAAEPSAFYQRTHMRLQRADQQLADWAKAQDAAAVMQRLATAMDRVCDQLPETAQARVDCQALFQSEPAAAVAASPT
ncbi:MAG: dihydroneopterin aldolase [Nevskiales bacterium]|nr:dihydroneopterin aldolase [Nevskiales bacterium]